MQSRDQKKLSEFEVAQFERLTRRMDDWQRGGLRLWLKWRLSPRPFAMGRSHQGSAGSHRAQRKDEEGRRENRPRNVRNFLDAH